MSDYLDAKVTATYQPNLGQAILHQKGTKWRHGLYNAIIGHNAGVAQRLAEIAGDQS